MIFNYTIKDSILFNHLIQQMSREILEIKTKKGKNKIQNIIK